MRIRSGVKCALTTALTFMLVLSTSLARANGRFPRGEHVLEFPSDPNRILLAATYGLVNTSDGGKNWYYICESAFSLYPPPAGSDPGYTGDPVVAVTADNSLIAGVDKRITRSTDFACGWSTVLEDASKSIDDIAIAPSSRNTAVALVRAVSGSSVQVYQTTDGGVTWAPIGTPLSQIVLGYTIDVDPKDPKHLMVTGVTSFDDTGTTGVFMNSTNSGMTWTTSPIPNTNVNAAPYIAAVHPTDGKKVFVRTDEWVDDDAGASNAMDALLYTNDGGQTWTELLRPKDSDGIGAKLYGFAISPDGATALAGYGDPVVGGGRNVGQAAMGVYKSTGTDYSFGATPKAILAEAATCLTWTAKGIYVCGSPQGTTSYIGFASDVSGVTSAGLKKIMQVNDLKGEPPCCSGRAVTSCDWSVDCNRFIACNDAAAPDAGVCMMPEAGKPDAGGSGGNGGSSVDAGGDRSSGGTGGGAGATGTGGAGGTAGTATTSTGSGGTGGSTSGCSCRTAGTTRGGSALTMGALFGFVAASGFRRSRRQKRAA